MWYGSLHIKGHGIIFLLDCKIKIVVQRFSKLLIKILVNNYFLDNTQSKIGT